MPESERQKCGTDDAPQSVHKGLGVRDREFNLSLKYILFRQSEPQILLRFCLFSAILPLPRIIVFCYLIFFGDYGTIIKYSV